MVIVAVVTVVAVAMIAGSISQLLPLYPGLHWQEVVMVKVAVGEGQAQFSFHTALPGTV